MSMTDPISDLLVRIRNAAHGQARDREGAGVQDEGEIVRILKDEGYIEDFGISEDSCQGTIEIDLKYGR